MTLSNRCIEAFELRCRRQSTSVLGLAGFAEIAQQRVLLSRVDACFLLARRTAVVTGPTLRLDAYLHQTDKLFKLFYIHDSARGLDVTAREIVTNALN